MKARALALHVVCDVFPAPNSKAPQRGAQESLAYRAARLNATAQDRAFATELAYGAIKMRRALDWQLAPFAADALETVPRTIAEILRLGAYEIGYTHAHAHATVFEFVNLAKKHGHRGLGNLVNAVLRNMLRNPPGVPLPESFADPQDYVGTRYSLPNWLVNRWSEAFDDALEAICSGVNLPARAAVLVNTARASSETVRTELRGAGVVLSPSTLVAESLLVDEGGGLLPWAQRTAQERWWIQSEASAAVVDVLNPQPGEAILDVCSGRGNKALQIAARLAGEGNLTCIERNAANVTALKSRLSASGLFAAIVVGDATTDVLPYGQDFDRVLLDAPCSGIGVVGRHPEARWRKTAGDAQRLAETQRALLQQAARSVRRGGTLVYAVCSNDLRETTGVVEWFLQRENFERGLIPAAYEPFQTRAGDVAIPPGIEGRDGFYIARLERR